MIKFYTKLILTCVFVLLVVFWALPTVKQKFMNSDYFNVKNIQISGVINGDGNRLQKMYERQLGENLFKFELKTEKVTEDKWIEKVEIKRIWPSTVKVIVYENKGLFTYKDGKKCFVYTYNSKNIPVECSGNEAKVFVKNILNKDYLETFANIYKKGSFDDYKRIVLRKSYFSIYKDNYEIKGSYDANAFLKAYRVTNFLTERYSSLEYLDFRVPEKIYAKGVLNEAG